jgi:D-hexose-6-phosphate mutarotase
LYRFDPRLTVTVGSRLTVALEVRNTDARAVSFPEAFHIYLAVGDVRTRHRRPPGAVVLRRPAPVA